MPARDRRLVARMEVRLSPGGGAGRGKLATSPWPATHRLGTTLMGIHGALAVVNASVPADAGGCRSFKLELSSSMLRILTLAAPYDQLLAGGAVAWCRRQAGC